MKYTLGYIAELVNGKVLGDPELVITGLASLQQAKASELTFCNGQKYLQELINSQAGAFILSADLAEKAIHDHCIVVANPYWAYARVSALFDWRVAITAGIAPSAHIHPTAQVDETAQIDANVVIDAHAVIGPRVYIGPQSVVGRSCHIAQQSRLEAGVVLYPNVSIGERVIIHSHTVIGSDGFGYAPHDEKWEKIYQIGCVVIENDVEIGACVTIDRGALDATTLRQGVKVDNLVHIAHNVDVGDHTVIAGGTKIAGSTKIGKRCQFAGMVGIAGHLKITDDTFIGGMSKITKSIQQSGSYASGTMQAPYDQWRKNVVRFKQLDDMARRLRALEEMIKDK